MKRIKYFFGRILICLLRVLPIKKNRIYFVSNDGNKYSCNPKAFFEYLYKNHKDEFDFYYCLNNNAEKFLPSDVKTAKYKSIKDLYYLYTSKFIVNNFRFHIWFKKRKSQIYIQTWHGGPLPMKAIEVAVENRLNKNYVAQAKNDGKYIDILTVGSDAIYEYFEKYFWCSGKIANIGTPRYDSVIKATNKDFEQAKKKLNLPLDKELILFAPTFKDKKSWEEDVLDNQKIVDFFKKKLKKDVVIGYRFHPNIAKLIDDSKLKGAINLTNIDDSDEVVFASDIVISDFSSIVIDGFFAKKKSLFYVPNLDDYIKNERDLWIDFDRCPLRFCRNEEELFDELEKLETTKQDDKTKKFYNDFGITENGNACENLYNLIQNYKWEEKWKTI